MLGRQKRTLIILLLSVVLLGLLLGLVNYIVAIYDFEDEDGATYYIRKDPENGNKYALFREDGSLCDKNEQGYYQTDLGTQLSINRETGKYSVYAAVDTDGTEELGYAAKVLLFKQLTYDGSATSDLSKVIKSIEIHNQHSSFTFERGENNRFVIKGNETLAFPDETFAKIASACGYTISSRRIDDPVKLSDGKIDFAEYGLAKEIRSREILDENGEPTKDADGNILYEKYEYSPSKYTVTTMSGEIHTVYIGDPVVSNNGYYAKYEGRDKIYVLSDVGFSDGALLKLESLITPVLMYPMNANNYFEVEDFRLYDKIDHQSIDSEFSAWLEEFAKEHREEGLDPDALVEKYEDLINSALDAIFEKNSHKICDFSYKDLSDRINTMYSSIPYLSNIDYRAGYFIDSDNVGDMLSCLYYFEKTETAVIDPSDDELEKYGLLNPEYRLEFTYNSTDSNGKVSPFRNSIDISALDGDVYYAYSDAFGMIVKVDASTFRFLEWEEVDWYNDSYIELDISYITDITLESANGKHHFEFDNSASIVGKYTHGSQNKLGDYKIEKNSDGKYVLTLGGKELSAIYSGDWLTGGIIYSKTKTDENGYILTETVTKDLNKDSAADVIYYYYYYVTKVNGEYFLAARIISADLNGNILGDDTLTAKPSYSSEYFVSGSGFLFFADSDSYVGEYLTSYYAPYKYGKWCDGRVFNTADGKKIIVDSKTGESAKISSLESNLYFCDRQNGSLEKLAVTVGETSKRPAERYYPTTSGSRLRCDEASGKIQIYSLSGKKYVNATFEDCTIGVWCKGSYYLTSDGRYIVVNEESGDFGEMSLAGVNSTNALLYADGEELSYELEMPSISGKLQNQDAVYNFRQFYKGLLYASLEGMAEISEEEMAALRALPDSGFSTDAPNNPCQLKLTVYSKDNSGNERNLVYRFYKISERKSYLTIESLDSASSENSSPEKGYGSFYVLSSFADKLIEDAEKIINAKPVTATSKY